MGDKQSDNSSPSSNYRTRYSSGIRPKKRQSYGDFVEQPIAKRRISNAGLTNIQKKIEEKMTASVEPEPKKEFSALILKDCHVLVEKLSDLPLRAGVQVPEFPPTAGQSKNDLHKKVLVKKCSFPSCNNTVQGQFFEIPNKVDLKGKWMKQLKKKYVPGMAVCMRHFDDSDFVTLPNRCKPVLKDGAVPKRITLQSSIKTSIKGNLKNIIEELFSKKLITGESYKLLEPFGDLTYKDIELGEKGIHKERVRSLANIVNSCPEEAYNFFNKAVPLHANIESKPVLDSSNLDYKESLLNLYPAIKNIDSVKSSSDLIDILIDAKLILEGVKTLVENSANFPLSSLGTYLNDPESKLKVEKFSKIVFLNSPQTFNRIREPLHLPSVSSLFPSLAPSEDEVHLESLTLGQLLNEASRLNSMPEESIRSLIPFGGCQLCPYSISTVSMYKHVISSVFFNAPTFFKFLAEYLPLPSILLFAKSPLTKECDSTADQVEPQTLALEESKKASESPCKKQNFSPMNEAATKMPPTNNEITASTETSNKEEFMRCICPKTGRNVAKLDVDTGSFLPKDLTVKVVGHILTITGCKEESGQKIEFLKTIELPNYVDADLAGCYYFKGKMSIHAPVLENNESDGHLSSSTTATNSECSSSIEKGESKKAVVNPVSLKIDDNSTPKSSKRKTTPKSVAQFPRPVMSSNDDDIPRNAAVVMNVDGQEYVSLIAEVSKLFKPSEIVVKVRENKTISVRGETKSSDPHSKSRLYAIIEREFDLPKKIERTTLKAGCSGDGLLKVFAKVASDQNGH